MQNRHVDKEIDLKTALTVSCYQANNEYYNNVDSRNFTVNKPIKTRHLKMILSPLIAALLQFRIYFPKTFL